jgi:type I phosphodiesterase/nucleotide pyrophosphatase
MRATTTKKRSDNLIKKPNAMSDIPRQQRTRRCVFAIWLVQRRVPRRPNRITFTLVRLALIASCAVILNLGACTATKRLFQGGEKQVRNHPRPVEPGPYVLVFGFDGAGYNQLMEAIGSGSAPNLQGMLGTKEGGGVYRHAYSAPNAISILPSTTIAAWSSIFTGATPAYTGVTGNEWFVREEMRFYAPAPVSVSEPTTSRQR